MATIFLLGPSEWAAAQQGPTPMELRRELATISREEGHRVILMEDEPDHAGEDMVAKFDRLLVATTEVLVLWPAGAKMSTTYTELVLLRKAAERGPLPRVWCLHHASVARIEADRFEVLEKGSRSRYLSALARPGINPVRWETFAGLRESARLLAGEW